MRRNLISYDFKFNSPEAANSYIVSSTAQGRVVRIAKVTGDVYNVDVLLSKGDTLPYNGAILNSVRKYKFNNKTFKAKGLKYIPPVAASGRFA